MASETLRRSTLTALAALGLLAVLTPAVAASPTVTVAAADERPLRGEVVRLTVEADGAPAAGYQVVAVYRPNSATGHREALPTVDSSGAVLWTPQDAGPVTLEAWPPGADTAAAGATPVASHTVAVRFGRFPPEGMAIMILAGLLLFGGAGAAFVLLMRSDEGPPAHEPPST